MKQKNHPNSFLGNFNKGLVTSLLLVMMLFISYEGHASHYRFGNSSCGRVSDNSRTVSFTEAEASTNPICSDNLVTFTASLSGAPTPDFLRYLNGAYTGQAGNSCCNNNLSNGNNVVRCMFNVGYNYASKTITRRMVLQ